MAENKDVLIIGGGPAGLTAAIYCARAGLSCAVFEGTTIGGQAANTYWIDNYPGFSKGISGAELGMEMEQQAKRFGAILITESVTRVDFSQKIKQVYTASSTYTGKAVIIAAGAEPRKLQIPGEAEFTGKGVSYCATCDGFFFRNKEICVIGGGDSALEEVSFLSNLVKKVYLIHRRDEYRAIKILQDAISKLENVEEVLSTIPLEVKGNDMVEALHVKNVKTEKSYDIPCDGIFVSVGRIPETDIYASWLPQDTGGYLLVDLNMATEIEGVFVAGDVRQKPLRQVTTAVSDGAIAANSCERYILQNNF